MQNETLNATDGWEGEVDAFTYYDWSGEGEAPLPIATGETIKLGDELTHARIERHGYKAWFGADWVKLRNPDYRAHSHFTKKLSKIWTLTIRYHSLDRGYDVRIEGKKTGWILSHISSVWTSLDVIVEDELTAKCVAMEYAECFLDWVIDINNTGKTMAQMPDVPQEPKLVDGLGWTQFW